ncbi:MAG: carbon-nitrogen hydrolase family protein [Pseudomonadota bacterium]
MPDLQIIKAAAVQASPVLYDLDACLDKAEKLIQRAASEGCDLIVFGEAWFPGYPFHIWLGAPAWTLQFSIPYMDNSLERGTDQFERLISMARDNQIMISAGMSERDGASLYLAQTLIGEDGTIISHRRKLKPTHVERSVFGEGYGHDLVVSSTELGNIGQLCCWEHIQPLSKYALYNLREQIHCAAWPSFSVYRGEAYALGPEVNMSASQVYAVEGQCFVIAASSVTNQEMLDHLKVGTETPTFLTLGGGRSMIFAPDGREMAAYIPENEEGLIIAELDMNAIKMAKAVADPAGHYSKPESTQLIHHSKPLLPVVSTNSGPEAHEIDPSPSLEEEDR